MRRATKQTNIKIGQDIDVDRHHSQLLEHAQSMSATGRDFVSDDLDDLLKKTHDTAFNLGIVEALADLHVQMKVKDGSMEIIASLLTADMDTHIERSVPIEYFEIDTPYDCSWVSEKVSYEEDDHAVTIKFWKV